MSLFLLLLSGVQATVIEMKSCPDLGATLSLTAKTDSTGDRDSDAVVDFSTPKCHYFRGNGSVGALSFNSDGRDPITEIRFECNDKQVSMLINTGCESFELGMHEGNAVHSFSHAECKAFFNRECVKPPQAWFEEKVQFSFPESVVPPPCCTDSSSSGAKHDSAALALVTAVAGAFGLMLA
jgi:hypothetical protein